SQHLDSPIEVLRFAGPLTRMSTSAFSALRIVIIVLLGSSALAQTATVTPLPAPATPFPSESQSAGISQFSFIVYGDTRSRHDGIFIQPDHLMVVEGALDAITRLKTTPYPVRFALFSGDAVVDGRNVLQWNK